MNESPYSRWIARFDGLGAEDVSSIRADISAAELPAPLVVIHFDHRSEIRVEASIERLKLQILDKWRAELCFHTDCSAEIIAFARTCALGDSRLSVKIVGVEREVPVDRDRVTSVLFICGGVLLRKHALYMFALAASNQETAVVYSDEDRLGDNGERMAPIFKPDFSPELFENKNYLGNCVLLRTSPELLGAAISNFVTRYCDVASLLDDVISSVDPRNVIHIPHILFHDTIERRPRGRLRGCRWLEGPPPSVSIIIPTRDRVDLLRPCLESIQTKTQYPRDRFEIVVIDNGSRDRGTIQFLTMLASSNAIRLVQEPGIFNFSRMNNRAAALCRSDVLVFLNNDTTVIEPLWLQHLVQLARRCDVGAVGGKLLYPDGTVQHAGVVVGIHGSAVHSHVGIPRGDPGFQGLANVTREVAAVTAACMAIRRDLFEQLGGFDEELAISFNDTDLCLRALEGGYRNICVGDALLIHHESKTRGHDDTPEKVATARREAERTRKRHARLFKCDPYYNQNLSVDRLHELAFPPRRTKPWRDHARRGGKLRILFLSLAHGSGHCVSRLIAHQAKHLASAGHVVLVSSPNIDAELADAGCRHVEIAIPDEAASFAVENDIDCVVAHEPPFFSVARWNGDWPKVICCDHGELPREIFADERERIEVEKRWSFSMAHCVIPAPGGDGSSVSPTQMMKCTEDLEVTIQILCSMTAARLPPNALVKSEGRYIGGMYWTSGGPVVQGSNLKDANRREFYAALRGLDGSELVDQAYLAILGRYADQSGRAHYIDRLSKGVSTDRIIWEIATSDEASERGVCPSEVIAAAGLTYIAYKINLKRGSIWSAVLAKIGRRA